MDNNYTFRIEKLIESNLEKRFFWPQLSETIMQAIDVDHVEPTELGSPRNWGPLLPAWCCEAVGGSGELTAISSAAWKLFHIAANTLDNVADHDAPLEWWRGLGSGVAVNTATALILAAESLLLSQVENQSLYPFGLRIFKEFNQSLEIVSSGQHMDLVIRNPAVDLWWEIAAAKSGEPFALACKIGAIIATDDEDRIEAFYKFGHNLGVIIQIQDDVHDFVHEDLMSIKKQKEFKASSLPISYSLEVMPDKDKNHIRGLINELNSDQEVQEVIDEIIKIVEDTGAMVYIETKKDLLIKNAKDALDLAVDDIASKRRLVDLLKYLSGP